MRLPFPPSTHAPHTTPLSITLIHTLSLVARTSVSSTMDGWCTLRRMRISRVSQEEAGPAAVAAAARADRGITLTATSRPVSACTPYLTRAVVPSPRVRPSR